MVHSRFLHEVGIYLIGTHALPPENPRPDVSGCAAQRQRLHLRPAAARTSYTVARDDPTSKQHAACMRTCQAYLLRECWRAAWCCPRAGALRTGACRSLCERRTGACLGPTLRRVAREARAPETWPQTLPSCLLPQRPHPMACWGMREPGRRWESRRPTFWRSPGTLPQCALPAAHAAHAPALPAACRSADRRTRGSAYDASAGRLQSWLAAAALARCRCPSACHFCKR